MIIWSAYTEAPCMVYVEGHTTPGYGDALGLLPVDLGEPG